MSRPALIALVLGVVGLAALAGLGLSGAAVMPSYLGAWLFARVFGEG